MISKVLSENQINRIHETSLDILNRVGICVPHKQMLRRFADSGAEVDHEKWMDSGATSMEERCRQRKEDILLAHNPEPLPVDIECALDEVVLSAKRDLG